MLETIGVIISLLGSCVAVVIAIYSSVISKRNLVVETITKNRINWITEFRSLLSEFTTKYISHADKCELKILREKLALYADFSNKSAEYISLFEQIDKCVDNKYKSEDDKDLTKLILCSQQMLSSVWKRMKMEAGISKRNEKRIVENLNNDKHAH